MTYANQDANVIKAVLEAYLPTDESTRPPNTTHVRGALAALERLVGASGGADGETMRQLRDMQRQQLERELTRYHAALVEACRRLMRGRAGARYQAYKDLLAFMDAPSTAPRPWEPGEASSSAAQAQ